MTRSSQNQSAITAVVKKENATAKFPPAPFLAQVKRSEVGAAIPVLVLSVSEHFRYGATERSCRVYRIDGGAWRGEGGKYTVRSKSVPQAMVYPLEPGEQIVLEQGAAE